MMNPCETTDQTSSTALQITSKGSSIIPFIFSTPRYFNVEFMGVDAEVRCLGHLFKTEELSQVLGYWWLTGLPAFSSWNYLRASSSKIISLLEAACIQSVSLSVYVHVTVCLWDGDSWWAYIGPATLLLYRTTLGIIPIPDLSMGAVGLFLLWDCTLLSPDFNSYFTFYPEISFSDSVFQGTQSLTLFLYFFQQMMKCFAYPQAKKINFLPCTKINLKWVMDLGVKCKVIKLLEKN